MSALAINEMKENRKYLEGVFNNNECPKNEIVDYINRNPMYIDKKNCLTKKEDYNKGEWVNYYDNNKVNISLCNDNLFNQNTKQKTIFK